MATCILRERLFEVYKHTNKINGKSYIGLTCSGVRGRLYSHESAARLGSQLPFHRAIRRYGIEAFETTVLASCFGQAAACQFEILLIKEFGTFGNGGYNATLGGEGASGTTITKARRKAISKQFKELVRTDQHKARISAALKGRDNSIAVAAAANAKRGVPQDLVRKAASLAALEKARNAWLGGVQSPESRAAMRKSKSRAIVIEWPDGTKDERITTLSAISEEYGMSVPGLSMAIAKCRAIRYHKALSGCKLSWG